jgi:RNA polymerase sigma factor (sigma-70 family)
MPDKRSLKVGKNLVTFSNRRGCIREMTIDDMELVREYARNKSETAFATLVSRYVNLVYSVALRQVGNSPLAEEVTQTVFIIFARKAEGLGPKTVLSGWFCQTTRYTSAKALTRERRRQNREQEAFMRSTLKESGSEAWTRIAPLLDSAMETLPRKDHNALILRYFEGRSFKEVSTALETTEAGAKMRVTRALEKLRKIFQGRGVTLSSAAIGAAVAGNAIQSAPPGLGDSVLFTATKGIASTPSITLLTKETLKLMAWTKLKIGLLVGTLVIAAAGTATVNMRQPPALTKTARFAFAGYTTPEATIQSMLWGAETGELENFLAAFTPLERERFKNKLAGMPKDEIKRKSLALARALAGYTITQKEVISEDEIHVHVSATPSDDGLRSGKTITILKKIGNEWKRAGEID